jgi:two-component system, sensor histidine kinase and response regulator
MMTKERILIVEDSMPVATMLRERLVRELSVDVVHARNYAEAVTCIENADTGFFLAILDLALPDAEHGEIVDHALAHKIPSMVYTSHFDPELRQRLLGKNVIDYVIKTCRGVETLVYSVQRLLKNRSVHVLVVDDSTSIRRSLRSMLKTYMLRVHVADSAETALAILEKHNTISVVVTDYEMPGMDGVEFCARIRETRGPHELAVIGISSRELEFLSVRFIKSGANDFIKKPFCREEFYLRVIHNQETIETFHKLRELNDLKNRFLGMAVHDLRNPINGIMGFSQMLSEELQEQGAMNQAEIAGIIHTASTQMLHLVNDLLDISVIESGKLDLKPEPTDLAALIQERARIVGITSTARKVDIRTEMPESLSTSCDGRRIAQVVDNLLANAVKFSPVGGLVTISLENAGADAVVCVSDQGPGVPEDQQHRLFKYFSKIDSLPAAGKQGTGLGLAIVRKIVETHGGRVWMQSQPGNGARFFFSLPARSPDECESIH